MTSIAPAGVYVWGDEDPKQRSGGATYDAEILPPSAYNRDLIQPSDRRRAPKYTSQRSASFIVRPTPSASAEYTPEPIIEPSEYNKDQIEPVRGAGRLDGRSAYIGKSPRLFVRGMIHSVSPLDASTPDVPPAQQAPEQVDKPSLEAIAEAAGQLGRRR